MNELINTEPAYDPEKPGLRTHGDMVPINHGGELKLYFGIDRIIAYHGGTVAYATAVKSVPAVLSSQRDHGLENYPHFYSVNSAEATQIMSVAEDLIRYMALRAFLLLARVLSEIGLKKSPKPVKCGKGEKAQSAKTSVKKAPPAGIEPATPALGKLCSIH